MPSTAFHVSTPETLSYADAKVTNLLNDDTIGIGEVVVVMDDPAAIEAAAGAREGVVDRVLDAGGAVRVCSNALGGAAVDLEALPDGVERASSGVGELTRLQSEGFAYIRLG